MFLRLTSAALLMASTALTHGAFAHENDRKTELYKPGVEHDTGDNGEYEAKHSDE